MCEVSHSCTELPRQAYIGIDISAIHAQLSFKFKNLAVHTWDKMHMVPPFKTDKPPQLYLLQADP